MCLLSLCYTILSATLCLHGNWNFHKSINGDGRGIYIPWWSCGQSLCLYIFITYSPGLLYLILTYAVSVHHVESWHYSAVYYIFRWSQGLSIPQGSSKRGIHCSNMGHSLRYQISRNLLLLSLTTLTGVVIQYSMFLLFQLFSEKTLLCLAVVMVSIVSSHESALLNTDGKSIWSGETAQDVNNTAMTWSLAKELYGLHGQYFIVVPSLLFGMVATIIQWLFSKVVVKFYWMDIICWKQCCRDGQGLVLSRLTMWYCLSYTWWVISYPFLTNLTFNHTVFCIIIFWCDFFCHICSPCWHHITVLVEELSPWLV